MTAGRGAKGTEGTDDDRHVSTPCASYCRRADALDPNWFSPALLQRATIQLLQMQLGGFRGLFGPYQSVQPGDNGSYVVHFAGGSLELSIRLDDQGRISSLGSASLHLHYLLAPDEQELQFSSGSDTLYGTFLLPAGAISPPAALLIAGSGPTDRNGNSPLLTLQLNTLSSIARALAGAGVASLRYDKLGSGRTGLAGHAPTDDDFNTFLDEALAAYDALTARPEVDASRLLAVGHSEGGLFAELVAQQVQGQAPTSRLILAVPLGSRALDTIRQQLTTQFDAALAAGQSAQDAHDSLLNDLESTITSIRQDGTIPDQVFAAAPNLRAGIFDPGIGPFLQQEDGYDPAQVAAQLPASLPVLLLHGDQDANVDGDDVQHLLRGFQAAGNTNVVVDEFPRVDHDLRQIPQGQAPSLHVSYPFSADVTAAVSGFAGALFV